MTRSLVLEVHEAKRKSVPKFIAMARRRRISRRIEFALTSAFEPLKLFHARYWSLSKLCGSALLYELRQVTKLPYNKYYKFLEKY